MNMLPDPESVEILIVDDNPANLGLLNSILTDAGWRVRIAPDGSSALTSVVLKSPNLILLDINMPDPNGWEVCRRIKKDSALQDIPIIFLSALTETKEKLRAFEMGGVDYITKPFSAAEVLARVKVHLHLSATQAMLAERSHELLQENAFRRKAEQALRVTNASLEEKVRERTEELTKINRALAESEQRYVDLYDHSPDMYVSVNAETACVEVCNQTLVNKLGFAKEEVIGSSIFNLYHPDCLENVKQTFLSFVTTGEVHNAELALIQKDGAKIDVNLSMTSVRDEQGNITYGRSCWIDITERKRIELALAAARERAELANQAKSEFLAMMSHEIRTPMNAILGNIELLQEKDITEEERLSYLAVQQYAGESLLKLIDDILELSRLEAGGVEQVSQNSFDLRSLMKSVASMLDRLANAKGISIQVEVEQTMAQHWIGDERRIRQVLLNLAGNAVKFTKKGDVQLKAKRSQKGEGVTLTVADTGIGIPQEQQQHIFDKFYQVDSTSTRQYGGSGLGLAIVNKLIHLMNGSINVESVEGSGTRFELTLPIQKTVSESLKPSEFSQIPSVSKPVSEVSLSILLAEDSKDNAILIRSFLKRTNHHLTIVENGALALEAVQKNTFDLVLMDMQMPVMDGYAATKEIRRLESEGVLTPIPILALTAHALAGDSKKSLAAGCDAHLTKPIKKMDLLQTISKHARH
ncbi:MAG: response regulator [Magnetococcales bacterium]|nr:response regulator [Magnetococcales bacterium]